MDIAEQSISSAIILAICLLLSVASARAVARRELAKFSSTLAQLQTTLDRIEAKLNTDSRNIELAITEGAIQRAVLNGKEDRK